MLLWATAEIVREAIHPLLGERPDKVLMAQIREICSNLSEKNLQPLPLQLVCIQFPKRPGSRSFRRPRSQWRLSRWGDPVYLVDEDGRVPFATESTVLMAPSIPTMLANVVTQTATLTIPVTASIHIRSTGKTLPAISLGIEAEEPEVSHFLKQQTAKVKSPPFQIRCLSLSSSLSFSFF